MKETKYYKFDKMITKWASPELIHIERLDVLLEKMNIKSKRLLKIFSRFHPYEQEEILIAGRSLLSQEKLCEIDFLDVHQFDVRILLYDSDELTDFFSFWRRSDGGRRLERTAIFNLLIYILECGLELTGLSEKYPERLI